MFLFRSNDKADTNLRKHSSSSIVILTNFRRDSLLFRDIESDDYDFRRYDMKSNSLLLDYLFCKCLYLTTQLRVLQIVVIDYCMYLCILIELNDITDNRSNDTIFLHEQLLFFRLRYNLSLC